MKTLDLNFVPLEDSNLKRGVSFIRRLNQTPVHSISYLRKSMQEIAEDVKAIQPPDGYGFVAISNDDQIVGLFGVEMDIELGRCWLFGPFVELDEWDAIADRLYDAILDALPGEITNQEMFFPDQNTRVHDFAIRHGFAFYTSGAVLTLDAWRVGNLPESRGQDLDDRNADQFMALHDDVFPNTYYSGKQLLNLAKDEDKGLFVHQIDGKIVGYIFIQVREATRDGYIDFIGVEDSFRQQGIGKQLVASGIDWAYQFPFVEKVTLTVNPENIPAMQMYHNLGFKIESVAQGYRKQS